VLQAKERSTNHRVGKKYKITLALWHLDDLKPHSLGWASAAGLQLV